MVAASAERTRKPVNQYRYRDAYRAVVLAGPPGCWPEQ
jgi:hypothetical protein